MKNRMHQITAILVTLLILCGCARSYSGQFYSFPPGSKPHESDWTYLCKIIVWDPFGKKIGTDKGKRKIQIIIHDKSKNNVLVDDLEIESASIQSKVQWDKIDSISLVLYEVGNKFAEDDYNKQLVKAGPKHLITLKYVWNGEKYIKSST